MKWCKSQFAGFLNQKNNSFEFRGKRAFHGCMVHRYQGGLRIDWPTQQELCWLSIHSSDTGILYFHRNKSYLTTLSSCLVLIYLLSFATLLFFSVFRDAFHLLISICDSWNCSYILKSYEIATNSQQNVYSISSKIVFVGIKFQTMSLTFRHAYMTEQIFLQNSILVMIIKQAMKQ